MDIVIIVLVAVVVVMNIILLIKVSGNKAGDSGEILTREIQLSAQNITDRIIDKISKDSAYTVQENIRNQKSTEQEITRLLNVGHMQQADMSNKMTAENKEVLGKLSLENKEAFNLMLQANKESQLQIIESNQMGQNRLAESMKESMNEIRKLNEEKLNDINKSVSEKLDKSLNERLDQNFKQIGERLGSLYESLGELNKLTSGVTDLNKTLSNVKTRGVWGEIQLQNILEDTMTPNLYETNIITKKNSNERVEFAIKIPSKDNDNDIIYLPIDSKFPSDIYNKIVISSEEGNAQGVQIATKELETRIKTEARTIRDKYIDPPNTTDFGIMFLPTESLYSEVLRINGLNEWCQTNCKVIISGPTTITALLNSLRVGFSNLTLNKKTKEVIKTLQAVKTQYNTMDELIDKTQKKLNEAMNSTDNLKKRTQMIQNKMKNIDTVELEESNNVLGITEEVE